MKFRSLIKNTNWLMVLYVVAIVIIGIGILGSSVYAAGLSIGRGEGDMKKDFIFMGVALIGLLVISKSGLSK